MSPGVCDAFSTPSIFPFFEIPPLRRAGGGAGGGLLSRAVPPHLAHPALHLFAEIVVPAAVGPDFRTVFASTHLVPLPVIWLSGRPVPRKAGWHSSSGPYPCKPHPHLRKAQPRRVGFRERAQQPEGEGRGFGPQGKDGSV